MSTTTTVTASAPAQAPPAPTPLGSALDSGKAGSGKIKRLHQIPVPESKEAARKWQLEQMAAAFRIFAKLGFSDGSSGHISLRGMFSSFHPFYYQYKQARTMLRALTRPRQTGYVLDQPVWSALWRAKGVGHGPHR